MQKENNHIRRAARAADIPLWAVAAELGISEPTLIRWLRLPLAPEREQQVMAAIERLAREVDEDE